MEEKYVQILYKMALKAYRKNEMPVSALIVYNNKIIAKAYNKKNIKKNALFHAEILCINKACKKLKRWNLSDCTIYVTLEPCLMCKEAIQESRIGNVFYILNKGKITNKYSKTKYEQLYVCEMKKFINLIDNFFIKLRH